MDYQKFNEKFLETLLLHYPKRSGGVKELAEHLRMDQKNLARRMRGETPFTVEEITKICVLRNISLDSLLFSLDEMVHPMKIYMKEPTSSGFPESFLNLLKGMEYTALDRDNGTVFFCTNFIPNGMYMAYPVLAKFIYFLWDYRRNPEKVKSIEDLHIEAEMEAVIAQYAVHVRSVKSSVYLFSPDIIENVARYILSVHETNPFPSELLTILIGQLAQLIDEIEHCALHGTWPGTDNSIEIYVTPMILPNGIMLTENSFYKTAVVYAFFQNPIISVHPQTYIELRTLAHSMLRYAENISVSGEKNRVLFIQKQRDALSRLSDTLKFS